MELYEKDGIEYMDFSGNSVYESGMCDIEVYGCLGNNAEITYQADLCDVEVYVCIRD